MGIRTECSGLLTRKMLEKLWYPTPLKVGFILLALLGLALGLRAILFLALAVIFLPMLLLGLLLLFFVLVAIVGGVWASKMHD